MKQSIVFLIINHLLVFSDAQDCQTKASTELMLANYMQCIKDELSQNYKSYEREVRQQTRQAVEECFDPNKCPLSVPELSAKAWDEKGLYADCPLCIKLLGAVVSSTLKAPLKEQQCIRREVGKAVVRESQQCLQSKNIDFHIPPTPPDLEESSSAFLDNVATAISDYVHIHNKLYSCGLESKSTASKTVKCLRKPFPRYLPTHCEALHQCDQQVPSSCTASINIVKKSMCACLHNVRHEVVKRFETLDGVIRQLVINAHNGPAFGPGSSLDTCAASIKGHMSTTVNNWFVVIDQALELCIQTKPLQGLLTMDSLVNLGCKTILKHRNEQSKTELIRAFVMVGNYVDALSDRSSRFCGPHC